MKILSHNVTSPQISKTNKLDLINSTSDFEKADQQFTTKIQTSLDEVAQLLEQIGS
jgi:hypothetical protein